MTIFDDTNAPSSLDDLVGEGKKYKTPADLARAVAEKDNFIEQLKNENQEIRQDLSTAKTVEDQLREFNESRSRTPVEEPHITPAAPAPRESQEDLSKRIRAEVQNLTRAQLAQKNLDDVSERMVALYGSEENAAVETRKRAQAAGLGVDFVQDIAARSPQAFFSTLGIEMESRPSTPSAPRSDVNPAALAKTGGQAQEGTYEFYKELRRTKPSLYHSPQVQQQMMRDAKRLGEKFYPSE